MTWTRFQYTIRRLIVKSRKVSKPRDLYQELSDRSEIWQAPRQHCCRRACKISKRCDHLNQSRGFETSRDLTIRRLTDIETGPCHTVDAWHIFPASMSREGKSIKRVVHGTMIYSSDFWVVWRGVSMPKFPICVDSHYGTSRIFRATRVSMFTLLA